MHTELHHLDHFLYSDQPCTCPTCGARTEILKEWKDEMYSQLHVCLNPGCGEMFVMEEDVELIPRT